MVWAKLYAGLRKWLASREESRRARASRRCCNRKQTGYLRLQFENLEARLALSTLPAGFEESVVAGGLYEPTSMVVAPDGRIFVTEKPFDVRIVENGQLLPTPFISLSVERGGERGVEGVVLDPNFETNGFVYVYYTHHDDTGSFDRLSRFTVSATNHDVADPTSERVLIDGIPTFDPGYHNGGLLQFGADGMLYVSIGDTTDTTMPQDLSKLQGKILRINPAAYPNIVPADNPYVGLAGDRGEIWASGFRNPFTGKMLPGTSQLYVNDVGSGSYEEVNQITKGGNFGWPTAEGFSTNPAFVNPIYNYAHNGQGAAITGAEFYIGSQFPPSYQGQYFFGDYVRGFIRTLDVKTGIAKDFATGEVAPIGFANAPDGGLYWLSIGPGSGTNGAIYKISYSVGNHSPIAVASADRTDGLAPLTVSFSGQGSSDPDNDALTYSWDFGDGQTGTGSSITHTYSANGQYSVKLTVSDRPDGSGLSNTSTPLIITVGNQHPTPSITLPVVASHYNAGDVIAFAGTATDPQDGTLPASDFNWSIVFHHNTHTHPFIDSIAGVTSGTFQIPVTGETDPDQWYRITLTVTDSGGLQQQTYVDVLPNLSTFSLASNISGAQIDLDGQPEGTPGTITGVVGMQRLLAAPDQTINNKTYRLASWSDGGAATHTIVTPATATTYIATYDQVAYGALYSTNAPDTWLQGQSRTFTTTLTNTGTQTWSATGTNAVHLGIYFDGRSDAIYDWATEPARFVLPQDVAPGQTATITVTVTAPATAGNFVLRQRLVKEYVQWFDQLQATPVEVGMLAASYSTNAPANWQPGQTQSFTTTVTNTGSVTWNAADPEGVHLGVYFDGNSDNIYDWQSEPLRFVLPNDVPPGASATIVVTATAPAAPGNYVLRQRMVKEFVGWFSDLQKTNVAVGTLAASYSSAPPTAWAPSATQSFSLTLTNTGNMPWNAAGADRVRLSASFGGASDVPLDGWITEQRFDMPSDVAPGQSVTLNVAVTSPAAAGNYVLRLRLEKETVGWFDQMQKRDVQIISAPPSITNVTPASGVYGVLTDSSMKVTFSGAIDPATINASDFVLVRRGTTTPIPATIRFDSTTGEAILQPSAFLLTSTTYTATIKGGANGVKNMAGIPLAADRTWSFTTTSTPADASRIISQSVPSYMVAGRSYAVSITVQNTGTRTWDTGSYSLGFSRGNMTWGLNRVALPTSVAPGARVTFKFTIRAPQASGYYNFQWQMLKDQAAWFGSLTSNVRISVRR
jgi:glucose/arabinose dehydrogenase